MIATELWDAEALHILASRWVEFARDAGALVQLQLALSLLALSHLLAGELTTRALLLEEDRLIAEATGNPELSYGAMFLLAWRGREAEASELIQAIHKKQLHGSGRGGGPRRVTQARCSITVSVATTPAAMPPSEHSRRTTLASGASSYRSWRRRHRGPVTRTWSRLRSNGSPNARLECRANGFLALRLAFVRLSARAMTPRAIP